MGSAVLALGLGGVLCLSAWLVPAGPGYGTHLQLGLGTCSFLALTGLPCPMCGATTTFALMAHLRPLSAFANQPFAALLFLLTTAAFAVACAEVAYPRDRWRRALSWVAAREAWLAVAFLGAMTAGWLYKIVLVAALEPAVASQAPPAVAGRPVAPQPSEGLPGRRSQADAPTETSLPPQSTLERRRSEPKPVDGSRAAH
jgi:Protein of unknown function (DUF2752)